MTTTKRKLTSEEKARCEVALWGRVVQCSNEVVQQMTDYILSAMGSDLKVDILERLNKYSEKKVTYIVTNTVMGMPTITYLLEAEDTPKPFEEDYGTGHPCAFCYVLNIVADDMCSEYGDCFFQKKEDGYYHRVS